MKVGLATLKLTQTKTSSTFWACTSSTFNQSGLKILTSCYFWWKRLSFELFSQNFCQKFKIKCSSIHFIFKNKTNNTICSNFNIFWQNLRNFRQKLRKMWPIITQIGLVFTSILTLITWSLKKIEKCV